MHSRFQNTIDQPFTAPPGIGLHSGATVNLRCLPAPADYGVRFIRTDLPGQPEIPARLEYLDETSLTRQTSLRAGEARVGTVEHLLATCSGLNIDNLRVEIDGPELPLFDGSALPLAQGLSAAGIVPLNAPCYALSVERPFVYEEGDAQISVLPADRLELMYFAHFQHAAIGNQVADYIVGPHCFEELLAPARTFCTLEEVEALRAAGLIRGGNPDCAIVFGPQGPMNTQLRFANEAARHKLLDLLGDLFLFGRPIAGLITASRTGHRLHAAFLRAFLKEVETYEQPRIDHPSHPA